MSDQDTFERILASLHATELDPTQWPATSALIDEACDIQGNALLVSEGPQDASRVLFFGLHYREQRREDYEREYFDIYHPIDERIPRALQLPYSHLVHVTDLYTAEELQTSPTYNEALPRGNAQDSLNVHLDGLDGSSIGWSLNDPVTANGWESSQVTLIKGLLPHFRQFVRVQQTLGKAEALGASVTELLDNHRVGVIHLDRRGQIVAANDRARALLLRGAESRFQADIIDLAGPDGCPIKLGVLVPHETERGLISSTAGRGFSACSHSVIGKSIW